MWQITHWICEQHSAKTNACQGCDQNLRQTPRLYRWSKSSPKFRRQCIQLQTPKYLCAVHTRLALFMFVNSTTFGFFLGPVTTFGSPSSHCVMDFKVPRFYSHQGKDMFLFPRTVQADTGTHSDLFQRETGVIAWTGTYCCFKPFFQQILWYHFCLTFIKLKNYQLTLKVLILQDRLFCTLVCLST